MGKGKEEVKQPIDRILDAFVDSLELDSAKQFRQVKNAFQTEDPFSYCQNEESKRFLDVLPQLMENKDYDFIQKLICDIRQNALNRSNYDWNAQGKKSYKTYLTKFLVFLENKRKNQSQPVEFNIDKTTLIKIFNRRLKSQDRVSGDKVWLPLKFISSIYTYVDNKSFSNWIDSLTNNIYIHFLNNGTVCKYILGEIDSLIFKQDNNSPNKYKVYVKKGKDEFEVLTPTGKGNKKELMIVKSIRDIAIDHVKPIDITLREWENDLPMLKEVSDSFKMLKDDKNLRKTDIIDSLLIIKRKYSFLKELEEELKAIGKDSPLRLMAAEYNSQKSNGKSFEKIIKVGKNSYKGIIEESIKYIDNEQKEKDMVLYQDLDDKYKNSGIMRIVEKDKFPKGKSITQLNIDINYI